MDGRLLDDEPVLVETAVFARTIGRILHVLEASHLPLELSFLCNATSQQLLPSNVLSIFVLQRPSRVIIPVKQASVKSNDQVIGFAAGSAMFFVP